MYTIKKGGMIMKLSNMRMNGFTLAEVLITLGIIGVVAAMTMPTLMNSTQGAQYKAAYKKALSAIAQGVTLNVALDGASFADAVAGTAGETDKPTGEDGAVTGDSVASILAARMNIINSADSSTAGGYETFPGTVETKACEEAGKKPGDEGCTETTESVAPDTFLFFSDGIVFAYKASDAVACTDDKTITNNKHCVGVIDVNGIKGPNKVVACDATNDTGATPCKVTNPTDIYPVEFYDQTILPASDAARAVLYGK